MKAGHQREISPPQPLSGRNRSASNGRVEPQSQYQVNLLPDRSTDQLRMHAHGANLVNARLAQSKLQKPRAKQQAYDTYKPRTAVAFQDHHRQNSRANSTSQERNENQDLNQLPPSTHQNATSQKLGFVRSKRNQAMVPDTSLQEQVQRLEDEKLQLIKRLNESLLQLDKLNEDKRQVHDQLLDQIKFVRDLHTATGGAGLDDLNSMVSQQVRLEYKQEQAKHKQLEAELLKADQERMDLKNSLQHLQQRSRQQHQFSQRDSYEVAGSNVNQLQHEVTHLKQECHRYESEIDKLTEELRLRRDNSNPELLAQDRAIAVLTSETHMLTVKTDEMVQREAQAMRSLGTEHGRIVNLNQHTAKLLCAKHFGGILQRATTRSYQKTFQQLWLVNNSQQTRTLRLCALYKVFQTFKKKMCRASMQTWYARAYEPKQTFKMNRDLPGFYARKDISHLQRNKYRIASSQTVCDKTRIYSVCRSIKHTTDQWQSRLLFSALKHWHRVTHPKATAIKVIASHFLQFKLRKKERALAQWQDFTIEKRVMIRLHALPVKIACQILEKRVLIALRSYALRRALRKRSRLLRAYKNLRVAVQRSKLQKSMTQLVGKISKESSESLKDACFSEINNQKEFEIVQQTQAHLDQINPQITDLKETNTDLQKVKDGKALRRAVHALTITPCAKQLSQVLQIWRQAAQTQTTRWQVAMRRLCLKIYKQKLRVAYDRMRVKENLERKKNHHFKIDSLHHENVEIQNQTFKLKISTGAEHERIKNLASKHLRRLCEQAFSRNLAYWLERWQKGVHLLQMRDEGLKKIIKKIRKSLLQQAMKRYRRGCQFYDQDDYNDRRVHDVKGRLRARIKKRVYHAIREFAMRHIERTRTLKYLIRMTDKHCYVRGMLQWQKHTRMHKEHQLLLSEKDLVGKLDVAQEDVSKISDDFNNRDIDKRRLLGILTLEAKLTLQKWLERSCMGGLQFGFQTWKQKAVNLKHRAAFLQSVRRHLVLQNLRSAWFRWQEASYNLMMGDQTLYCQRVERLISEATQKIKYQQESHTEKCEEIRNETDPYVDEARQIKLNTKKVIEMMILKRAKNYFMFKQRYILQKWQQHSKSYKRCGRALERGITKLMLQRGWNQVRGSVRYQILQEKRQRSCKRMYRIYKLDRLRRYFNNWRDSEYNQEMTEIRLLTRETTMRNDQQERFRQETKFHHSSLYNQRHYRLQMQQIWDFWHKYAFEQALKRRETKELRQELLCYQARRCIKKWKVKVQTRIKQSAQIAKMMQKHRMIYQWAVFRNMRTFYEINKRMSTNTVSLMNCLSKFHLIVSFRKIKGASHMRHHASKQNRLLSLKYLADIFNRLKNLRLRDASLQLKKHAYAGQRLQAILQQWCGIGRVQRMRDYFYKWRFQCDKIECEDVNENQDGPQNLTCWNLRLKCNQLAEMMQYDGAPDELIHLVMYRQKQKFNYLTDKTVTRMMIHKDQHLKLLPYCLDKIRSHARVMKKWRRVLLHCQNLQQSDDQIEMYRAFKKWKDQGWRQKRQLEGTPYRQLIQRFDKDKIRLSRAAESVEDHVDALERFRNQRDQLFDSYLKGQRLAMSLANHNKQRGQHKALIKVSDHSNSTLQSQISQQVQNNLATLDQLKTRIATQEDENNNIAHRNDHYRMEAHQAARNAKLLQSVQNENHQLLVQQNEHAQHIKALIEENFMLTKQIEKQRVEAAQHLEHQNMLHYQKTMELERLKREERESATRRAIMSGTGNNTSHSVKTQQPLRTSTDRSLSPPQIVSPTTGRLRYHKSSASGKSPLRMRNLSAHSSKQQ